MFVTTLVFAKLVTWMRGQSGTSDLRALAYMDEVAGYVPPTAAPPAKKPILTILKQGRAFGLGLVLSTQNPVDLDYKAMSNAGTWLVGRLQTENDKARVLEGPPLGGRRRRHRRRSTRRSAALQKRQFMLVSAKDSQPRVFAHPLGDVVPPRAADEGAGAAADDARCAAAPSSRRPRCRRTAPRAAAPLAADETSVAPAPRPGMTVSYLDPAAPWASQVGAVGRRRPRCARSSRRASRSATTTPPPGSTSSRSSRRSTARSTEGLDLDAETVVDFDDRDFRPDAPAGAAYVLPSAPDRRGEVLRPGRQGRAGAPRREPRARGLPQQAAEADLAPRRDRRTRSSRAATRPARSGPTPRR